MTDVDVNVNYRVIHGSLRIVFAEPVVLIAAGFQVLGPTGFTNGLIASVKAEHNAWLRPA